MNDLIHDELASVLRDWQERNPVRTIVLGHRVRVKVLKNERGQELGTVEEPHVFRQKKVLDYVFRLIAVSLDHLPMSFEMFSLLNDLAPEGLSAEERQAAESLAWKAVTVGWKRAIAGHEEYIELRREADA